MQPVGRNKRYALKGAMRFAYMDVGEGREQDAEASLIAPYGLYWFWLCRVRF